MKLKKQFKLYGFSERLPVPLPNNISGFIRDRIPISTNNYFPCNNFNLFISKKKILRKDMDDLESLKLLQALRDSGTINEKEFEKKKNRITSKW